MKGPDFEHLDTIPTDQIIGRLKKAKVIPSLKGAIIFALGVDPAGKSAATFTSLRDFWFKFFRESGAEVRVFSIDRRVPDLNHVP